jgi:DNA-binding transcriptional ArsR family regulator
MNRQIAKTYAARARIMKALAHPTRLLIVDRLAGREYCVNELTDIAGCDVSTMSRHLGVLRNAGVVSDEKRGACIYYTLRCRCILGFFSCTDNVLEKIKEKEEKS